MMYFQFLPRHYALALTGLFFLASFSVLVLCIYKYSCSSKLRHSLRDGCLFLLLLPALTWLAADSAKFHIRYAVTVPWLWIVAFVAVLFVYTGIEFYRENQNSKHSVTPASVREALDDLNTGLCFADSEGKIVLLNHTMLDFSDKLLGAFPQSAAQMRQAVESDSSAGESEHRVSLSDGRVWRVQTVPLRARETAGYTQTTAQEITALLGANEQLRAENEQLRQTNEKMQQMYERLSERIREQETLALKMKIHNDIGTSLIKIREMMSGAAADDMEKNLAVLENAVSFFSNHRMPSQKGLEETVEQARQMKVALELTGSLPSHPQKAEFILSACRECVTNCVKHAGGNRVQANIVNENGLYTVYITNNGKAPARKISEGGGLGSLRKQARECGFEMRICCEGTFELILTEVAND